MEVEKSVVSLQENKYWIYIKLSEHFLLGNKQIIKNNSLKPRRLTEGIIIYSSSLDIQPSPGPNIYGFH